MRKLKYLIASGKGAHPDHGEKESDGAEDGVYWCGARGLLGDVQAIDGHVQCGDSLAALLSLWFVCHGRDARWTRGSGEEEPVINVGPPRCRVSAVRPIW